MVVHEQDKHFSCETQGKPLQCSSTQRPVCKFSLVSCKIFRCNILIEVANKINYKKGELAYVKLCGFFFLSKNYMVVDNGCGEMWLVSFVGVTLN